MKVSVIIPAYNAEQYIARTIESCLRQTSLPDEIIVADDGSTDRTAEVAANFPEPVRVIRLGTNCGLSAARNRAVEASTGDWLAFLDADDWFFPEKFELQRKCIRDNPHAVLHYSGFRMIPVNGPEEDVIALPPSELGRILRFRNPLFVGSVMLRRDAFDAVGGFDQMYRSAEDWDLWLRIVERFSPAAFAAVPKPLCAYRRVAGSLSSKAMFLLELRHSIIENRSLHGTSGVSRFLLHRKIEAFNYFDTAIAVREAGSAEYAGLILKSLALWPLPNKMLPIERYKIAAIMFMQHCGWWPNPFAPESKHPDGHRDING
ncbi:MAG: glycosyltransferase family 2 protein [Terracidiphilus sp.]